MSTGGFQAVLKAKWHKSSKEHQGMGTVVLAIIQTCVPGDAFLHAWDESLQARLMKIGRQSFKSTSRRPQQHRSLGKSLSACWGTKLWLPRKCNRPSVQLSNQHLQCAAEWLWFRVAGSSCSVQCPDSNPCSLSTVLLIL